MYLFSTDATINHIESNLFSREPAVFMEMLKQLNLTTRLRRKKKAADTRDISEVKHQMLKDMRLLKGDKLTFEDIRKSYKGLMSEKH